MTEELPDTLKQAEDALQAGRIETARLILIEYLRRVPSSERAWWLLSFAVPEDWQKIDCLERLLHLNPANADARQRLVRLRAPKVETPLPAVNPFIFDPEEDEHLVEAPAAGPAPAPVPVLPTSPALGPAAAAPVRPASPALGPAAAAPVWPASPAVSTPPAGPLKKDRWIAPAVIISLVLCVVLGVSAYAGVRYYRQQALTIQQTAVIAQALTDSPSRTLPLTWTPSPSLSPVPSNTRTPTHTRAPSSTPTDTRTPHPTLTRWATAPGYVPGNVGTEPGDFAPDFSLVEVGSGETLTLSQFKGQAVLLIFWATWCPVCRDEIPYMEQVYQKYRESGLVVIAVDSGESSYMARSFRNNHPMSYYVMADPDDEISNTYRIDSFPRNFFIYPTGRIFAVVKGGMDFVGLDQYVEAILPVKTPFMTSP